MNPIRTITPTEIITIMTRNRRYLIFKPEADNLRLLANLVHPPPHPIMWPVSGGEGRGVKMMSSTKIWSQEMWDLLPSSASTKSSSLSADMWHEQSAKGMNNDDTEVWKATNDRLPWILHHTLAFCNHNTTCSMWHSCRGYKEKIWLELSSTQLCILGAHGQRGLCWTTMLNTELW